jgi:hypothetical protein
MTRSSCVDRLRQPVIRPVTLSGTAAIAELPMEAIVIPRTRPTAPTRLTVFVLFMPLLSRVAWGQRP